MSARRFEADAREWLRRATDDLRWARHSLDGEFYPQACFACQQSAEKALKAYMFALGMPLLKTHSPPDLLSRVVPADQGATQFQETAAILDVYYAPTRYADVLDVADYTRARVSDAILRADEFLSWLEARIGQALI